MTNKFKIDLADRVLENCINDVGCLVYPTSNRSIRINRKMVSLSRIIYEKYIGELPYRSSIYRSCNNGKCLNPKHMLPSSPSDKFWLQVNIGKIDDCWGWMASVDGGGYGMFGSRHIPEVKAHRISWYLANGEIPRDRWVLHRCDNPACCNPHHLFLGNNQTNVDDKVKKNRQSRLFGIRNGRSKLTIEDVRRIRKLHINGYSYRDITDLFPISFTQTGRILRGESWSWVN